MKRGKSKKIDIDNDSEGIDELIIQYEYNLMSEEKNYHYHCDES